MTTALTKFLPRPSFELSANTETAARRPRRRGVRLTVDPALVERCRRGDAAAVEELFEASHDHVFTLALHLAGDEATAADVTQEVFLKLLDRLGQFRGEAELSTWLYRIVVNTFLDHRRSRRPWISLDPGDDGDSAADTLVETALVEAASQEDAALASERGRTVRRALAELAPRWRAPLVLRYSAGLAYDEIAEVLGIEPGTVASRLNRAHRRLAKKLRHLDPSISG